MSDSPPIKIVILGAGFGGLYAALRLDRTLARQANIEIALVDKTNYTLFTPMLHEVAASDVDPTDITSPIRKMLKRIQFYEADIESIDLQNKTVKITAGLSKRQRQLAYDHLVLSLGSETKFFDDQTREHALQMKTLGDAILLRNRMIGLLEAAVIEEDVAIRRRMLTFVMTGGGFAGVETVGAMNDFLHEAITFYPVLDRNLVRLILIDTQDRLLPQFTPSLGRYTEDRLRRDGIDIRLNTFVESYDGVTVRIKGGDPIEADTVVWTAGVTPSRIVQSLPLKKDHGRIVVQSTMESEEFPGVWAVGDCAFIPDSHTGKAYPQTAQHAIRQGPRLAKNIEAAVRGGQKKPFEYKTIGQLAAIGRRRGVAQIFGINFSGFIAWFLWRTTYLWKLPGIYKKIRVAMAWGLDLFFSKDVVQLITADDVRRMGLLELKRDSNPASDGQGQFRPEEKPAEMHK